jgi:hypothetical protein
MDKIAEDKVFLALTRPSVFMGLPLEAILPIIMVCMVLWGSFTTRSIPGPVRRSLLPGAHGRSLRFQCFPAVGSLASNHFHLQKPQVLGAGAILPSASKPA